MIGFRHLTMPLYWLRSTYTEAYNSSLNVAYIGNTHCHKASAA